MMSASDAPGFVRAGATREIAEILNQVEGLRAIVATPIPGLDPLDRQIGLACAVRSMWPGDPMQLANVVAAMIINSVESDISDIPDLS